MFFDLDVPDGWDYNPSAWQQRVPGMILSLGGLCIMLYLWWSQVQVVDGTAEVATGIFPLGPMPHAAAGAAVYLAAAITSLAGDSCRWRNHVVLVLLNGLAVVPLGGISLLLMISQPFRLDAWSICCFASTFISILMIGPVLDEVLAACQSLKHRSRIDSCSRR